MCLPVLGSVINAIVVAIAQSNQFSQVVNINKQIQSDPCVFDFSQSGAGDHASLQEVWGVVDDVVMGGVSSSGIYPTDGSVLFAGTVSTANSGGFASVRTRNVEPPLDFSSYQGMRLRLKGDGNRYKFLLRDAVQWDGIAYAYSFDTDAQTWITVDVPFSEMVPVFRARTMDPETNTIDRSRVRAFQFMLSKFEYDGQLNPLFKPGSFQLYIESVCTY